MNKRLETKDIIKSLRLCAESGTGCSECFTMPTTGSCFKELLTVTADRLEELAVFEKTHSAAKQSNYDINIAAGYERLVDHWRDVDD